MNRAASPSVRAVIFDKDGTLVSFHQTWDPAVAEALDAVCGDDQQRAGLAEAVGYDLTNLQVLEGSPFVAESAETLDLLVEPFADPRAFEDAVVSAGARNVVAEPGARETVMRLVALGVPMAIATNDSAWSAKAQFDELDLSQYFAGMLGYDSGFGSKPEPGMVEAAARLVETDVAETAMVGDSSTDVYSALAAGAIAVYFAPGIVDPKLDAAAHVTITNLAELVDLISRR